MDLMVTISLRSPRITRENVPFETLHLRIFDFVDNVSVLSQVSLLFEVENLAMASPATVSRCGMVYNDYIDLGWKPFMQSWLDKRHKVESTLNKCLKV